MRFPVPTPRRNEHGRVGDDLMPGDGDLPVKNGPARGAAGAPSGRRDHARATYDPDLRTGEHTFPDRAGQQDIQTDLFYDYRTNVVSHPAWHDWLRKRQPPLQVVRAATALVPGRGGRGIPQGRARRRGTHPGRRPCRPRRAARPDSGSDQEIPAASAGSHRWTTRTPPRQPTARPVTTGGSNRVSRQNPALLPGRVRPTGSRRQNTPLCTASSAGGPRPITAPNGGYRAASAGQPKSPSAIGIRTHRVPNRQFCTATIAPREIVLRAQNSRFCIECKV
jgi:hypothetical protein